MAPKSQTEMTSRRWQKSNIRKENRDLVTNLEDIGVQFQDIYLNLFSSSNPFDSATFLETFEPFVTAKMNMGLTKGYNREEVEMAIFKINSLGSPSPSGFPALFFQNHWSIVGDNVVAAVLELLNSRTGFQSINQTFITLIPTKKSPLLVANFKPISLHIIFYKIIAKVT